MKFKFIIFSLLTLLPIEGLFSSGANLEVSGGMVHNISNPYSFVKKSEYSVILFTAYWSGPSRMITPMYEQIAIGNEKRNVSLAIADVESYVQNLEFASANNVRMIPTILVFRFGFPHRQFDGANGIEQLRQFLLNLN